MLQPEDLTVEQYLNIDETDLEKLSEVSDYWMTTYKFYDSVKDKPYSTLSARQQNWIDKISEGLGEALLKYF